MTWQEYKKEHRLKGRCSNIVREEHNAALYKLYIKLFGKEQEKAETAEEILCKYLGEYWWIMGKYRRPAINAAEKFAHQQTIELQSLIANLEAQNKELREALEWIPVTERLPDDSGPVLGCMKDTLDQYICWYKPRRKLFLVYGAGVDPISDMKVTHWLPLPEPPSHNEQALKEDKQDG